MVKKRLSQTIIDKNMLEDPVLETFSIRFFMGNRRLSQSRSLARAMKIALRASQQGARLRFALFELDL